MMRTFLTYAALVLVFALISCGVIIAACRDSFGQTGYSFFWMLIPMTALFIVLTAANVRLAVPRLLLRGRPGAYCAVMFLLSFLMSSVAVACEAWLRNVLDIPPRIHDYLSPWILVDNACNCVLLFLIMAGLGFFKMYSKWKEEAAREQSLSESLRRYIDEVRTRLDPALIISRLDAIIGLLPEYPEMARRDIARFCDWLRGQLYELPSPVAQTVSPADSVASDACLPFLISPSMRIWRHVAFQIIVAVISFGAFFDAPDRPDFSADRQAGFWGMFLFLDATAYVVILILYPAFRKSGNLRRYVTGVVILAAAVVLPLILIQLLTYEPSPYSADIPAFMMALATLSSALTVCLFIGGVSVALMLCNWLGSRRRSILLQSEHVRQEYAFLRKQINPHFLFNVLNNAGILSDEEPAESKRMLSELRRLLVYQFDETSLTSTPLAEEIEFLTSYLSLQASRIEPFSFSISADGDVEGAKVPTLIFITFVENAVKHSSAIAGIRNVDVRFAATATGVEFICRNTFSPHPRTAGSPGGVGLANTMRRLDMLYGRKARLRLGEESGQYIVKLFIPANR